MNYYTYMHVKESDGKIFYIGKGSGRRAFSCSGRSKFWHHVEKKHGFRAEILMRFEKESDAFEHEKFLISCFREINTQLVNLTDGGEGSSGFKLSEETKIKIGTAVKNRDPSVNVKISNSLKGKIASEGTKLKLKERIVSKETRLKMSLSKLGRKKAMSTEKTFHEQQKADASARPLEQNCPRLQKNSTKKEGVTMKRKPKAEGLAAIVAKQDPVSIQDLTMQDFFAAFALQCYWNDPEVVGTQAQAAEWAYEMADEMLQRRAT